MRLIFLLMNQGHCLPHRDILGIAAKRALTSGDIDGPE
jgi:hypothetical protein